MDTPEDGELSWIKTWTGKKYFTHRHSETQNNHSLVPITWIVDLLVTQRPCPAWVAGAGEATVPRRVAVTLDTGTSLAGLAARLHSLAQPLSGGALCHTGACCPWPQPGRQVLELSVDVQVTEAAMEAGTVTSS